MKTLLIILTAYIICNLYVTRRITKAYYLNEERRVLHKKMIWFLPFIGPLLIKGFWARNSKERFDTMTKAQRNDKKDGGFYESGIGEHY